MKKTLLIYPPLGSDDIFIKDVPLSLVYLAAESVKSGFPIEILDLRLYPNWKAELKKHLNEEIMLAGISVMTGNPIKSAMSITDYIKDNIAAKVVWGGHHPTLEPDSTMKFDKIDFIIRGFGSRSLKLLISELNKHEADYSSVPALSYRRNGVLMHNSVVNEWEIINSHDIPYHLIEKNYDKYNRFNNNDRIMPIFTSFGCPYQCAFCMAPVMYKDMKKKWMPLEIDDVINHIKLLIGKYNITYISIYDDDSFIDPGHLKTIFERIIMDNIKVKIDFRGIRVDELDRLGDDYFELMEKAGVRHFQIGLESGSQKILAIMNKRINCEQVVRINKKLAKYKKLTPLYNLMTGVPGETIEDTKKTIDLVLRLYNDNKNCIIGFPAKFKPLPGTKLYDIALKAGLEPVARLEDWVKIDTADSDMFFPWYSKKYNAFINMFQITSFFVDRKILREIPPKTILNRILRGIALIYRPLALLRLRYSIYYFNIEYTAYLLFRKIVKAKKNV